MNKDYLKQYIANYGGIQLIEDISSILQELSQEWEAGGNKQLAYTLSDASFTLADVSNKLDIAQINYCKHNNIEVEDNKYQLEFDRLMSFFRALSIKDLQKAYTKNKDDIIAKLRRLEYLKKILNIKDDDKK